ncbi:hypothetical protein BX616_000410 [Lobosporangium transversale]|nr:hypothetical protein BX616_000410 [Lobosporangium transversale]
MSSSDSTAGSDFELVHDTHLLDNLSRVSVNHTEQAEGTCGDIFTFSIPTTSISGSSSYSGHNNSDSSADTLNHRKPSIATTTTTTTTTVTTIATAVSESESESETETETEAETGSERITTSEMNRTTQSTISNNALIATDNKSKQLSPSDKNDKSQNADADCCDPFCAICLDRIQPRHHAKGTLACRHEFHLSCISMAFSMSKDMVCPLCRYVHKDQPFMNLDSEDDIKPTSTTTATTTMSTMTTSSIHYRRLFQRPQQQQQQQHHPFSHPPPTLSSMSTLHEHPTSGTILSMMPSLFEASIGHGPTAGTIRTSPDGIFLKTSTWLLLYAMPFTVALCFLAFVLGKVETMWSKVSCLIGAAICYMVCWGLVVAIMDPDHEARAILNRLNEMQEQQQQQQQVGSITNMSINTRGSSSMSVSSGSDNNVHDSILTASTIRNVDNDTISETLYESRIDPAIDTSTFDLNLASLPGSSSSSGPPTLDVPQDFSWTEWVHQIYTQVLQNRVKDLAAILDDIPDMMGEW